MFVFILPVIPNLRQKTIATFADGTVILAVGKCHEEANRKLQKSTDQISG